jgi:hypothetical protein
LPPNIWGGLYELKGELLKIKYAPILNRNKKFNNINKGKRCFIIGNGPSIKDIDLTKLSNEQTFVVNSFILHKKYNKIHPKNYCFIDPAIFRPSKGSTKFFKDLERKIHKDTNIFVPLSRKDYLTSHNLLKKCNVNYLLLNGFFKENLKFNLDITKPIPDLMNVILSCIFVAQYQGFREMYLLGCEHNWPAVANISKIPRFFRKDYIPDSSLNDTYERSSYNVSILFKSYRLLKKKLTSTKIYNCTPRSYLTTFEFKKLKDVLYSRNS